MADVSFPSFFIVNKERITFEQIPRKDLVEGECYLMLIRVVDDDDFEVVPDNLRIAQHIDNRVWIGYHCLIVVKYLGSNTCEAEDGIRFTI